MDSHAVCRSRGHLIGYVYDAAEWCLRCATQRFGSTVPDDAVDSEGNQLGAIFCWSEPGQGGRRCDDCLEAF